MNPDAGAPSLPAIRIPACSEERLRIHAVSLEHANLFARRRNVKSPFKLNATLGRTYNADLDDVLRTKQALGKLGHFEMPSYGMTEYPDESGMAYNVTVL